MTEEQAARSICEILRTNGGLGTVFTMSTDHLRIVFQSTNGTAQCFDHGLRFAEDHSFITRHDSHVWLL